MTLTFTRSPDDRKEYRYDGIGSCRRVGGMFSRTVTASTYDGRAWTFRSAGMFTSAREAVDATGQVIGSFRRRVWYSYTGTLTWLGREYELASKSSWRNRFELVDQGRTVLTLTVKPWRRESAVAATDDPGLDHGLLLFATWVSVDISVQRAAAASS